MKTKNTEALISIVTATYNRSEILSFTIKSVLNQTYTNWELLIIGDCCTDDTESVVASFKDKRITFYNFEKNFGEQSKPNNYGVQHAKGSYIAFLNHDDIWFNDHLEGLMSTLKKNESDLVYSWHYPAPIDDEVELINCVSTDKTHRYNFVAPASTWLFKKRMFDEIGPWRSYKEVYGAPSQDWLARMYKNGKKITVLNKFTVVAIQSGKRKNSYVNQEQTENAIHYDQVTNNPFFREEILTKYFVYYSNQNNDSVLFFFKKGILNFLKKTILVFGIRPVVLKHFIRYRKKGAFINKLRKTRGLKEIR
ncbi:glycosyltransferase family 2 protein [Aquimarina pacifica]|uniref:glycosyltransferase family 2 protein n=1 Tax=Aquimarina pacifica TaxID=1296415 RepID=UPI0004720EB4|nr:glycosyltransferase family A protein [Aquimarina pacifica]